MVTSVPEVLRDQGGVGLVRDEDLTRNLASVLIVLGEEVQKGLRLVAEGLGAVQGASDELSFAELHQRDGAQRASHLDCGVVAAFGDGMVLHHLGL